jgi:hypothetical protein
MKFLEGKPLTQVEGVTLVSGLPRRLGPSIRAALEQGSHGDIRMVLTILNATRALALGRDPDYDAITKPRISGAEVYTSVLEDMSAYTVSY